MKLCLATVALPIAAVFSLAAGIVVDGLRVDAKPSDVGIVLGSKVMSDGSPSDRLRARLDKAAELYARGMFKHVLVSGGTGIEGFSEAKVMEEYLAEQGRVPRAAIIVDEHGSTTEATAENSAAIMKARNLASALIVTQYFHISRSRLALRQAGIRTVHGAYPNFFELRDLYSIARETIALPVYWASSTVTRHLQG